MKKGDFNMTTITTKPFFTTDSDEQVTLYTLKNERGMEVSVSDFGGDIVSIMAPDRDGVFTDVVLGYDDFAGYSSRKYYLGAMVGRCCNRIGKGKFTLNGKDYALACNDNGKNHLHGGVKGMESKCLKAVVADELGSAVLLLQAYFEDGEEGYPGRLEMVVMVTLSEENALTLRYRAQSSADTLCNFTNHSYFNLAGHASGDILAHELTLAADYFTEADAESIPTGRVLPVAGTPMDFRTPHIIGARIDMDYEPLRFGHGYDHNWVLRTRDGVGDCATLYDPASGRLLTCRTTSPCVQMYTGNFIDGTQVGKGGCLYKRRAGVCLETQFAPDAINHPDWDSPILRVGEQYDHTTIFQFSTK